MADALDLREKMIARMREMDISIHDFPNPEEQMSEIADAMIAIVLPHFGLWIPPAKIERFEDVTPEHLASITPGSVWRDTMAVGSDRRALVIMLMPATSTYQHVHLMELNSWKREFRMVTHGFLSRFAKISDSSFPETN